MVAASDSRMEQFMCHYENGVGVSPKLGAVCPVGPIVKARVWLVIDLNACAYELPRATARSW